MATGEKRDADIIGTVEEVVYRNPANDYAVLEIIDARTGKLMTAVGTVPYPAAGEQMSLWGTWKAHPDYGAQLVIEQYEKQLPTSTSDILRYLSSRAIKGVGPGIALKIVNRFGADTFEVIEQHPEWLTDIPGITRKKAAAIAESFTEQAELRELMSLCAGHIGNTAVTRVFREWGKGAAGILRRDPYRLCRGGFGIGFERADEVAAELGVKKDADVRVRAGISYVLTYQAAVNGHTCLPREKLIPAAAETLGLEADKVEKTVRAELTSGNLVGHTFDHREYIYLKTYDEAERTVTERLRLIARQAATFDRDNVVNLIERMEREWGITYAREQREAIGVADTGGVMLLTRGPGTGKTTVIRALLRIFDILGIDTVLAAPTGRAAKRMSEATVHEAKTLHRLLEMNRADDVTTPHFLRDEENPLDAMAVIVDESSMMDLPLMAALTRAMRRGSRLILVGDANQLPAVGCGNVLGDLIASGAFPTVALQEIFRQAGESQIVQNAHKILRGEIPDLTRTDGDFFFLTRQREDSIVPTVEQLIAERLPRAYGRDILPGIQVITPTHRGVAGTERLNQGLQARLNPPSPDKAEVRAHGVVFREGDKVMQIRNQYDIEWHRGEHRGTGVFNGDLGLIEKIEKSEDDFKVTILFDDREAEYDLSMLDDIEHAYAITVHKSQGSEYATVIMPIFSCGAVLQTRSLLYTAMTRAKSRLILVGRPDIFSRMIANAHVAGRYTGLAYRLKTSADLS